MYVQIAIEKEELGLSPLLAGRFTFLEVNRHLIQHQLFEVASIYAWGYGQYVGPGIIRNCFIVAFALNRFPSNELKVIQAIVTYAYYMTVIDCFVLK